ncbi:MAG: metallophosphoesterase family protein [Lachnospiraceae bacterium]|nr:metallophosphoesterase family protein [Lachnospiraceae bacterium]
MKARIGIISDTHGLLRPEVIENLQGCSAILHAGDINRRDITETLEKIAPLYVVRGNNDKEWAEDIPYTLRFSLCGCRIFMVHKKSEIPEDLNDIDLVVYGHSHKYEESRRGSAFLLNPGSCGPRRFHQPITMAVMTLDDSLQPPVISITKIDIPHENAVQQALKESSGEDSPSVRDEEWMRRDPRGLINKVIKEVGKGKTTDAVAARFGISQELAETISRMYLTHPGIDADGIMTKLEIAGR